MLVVVVVTLFFYCCVLCYVSARPFPVLGLLYRGCVCVYNFMLEMEMMMGYHKVINRFCTILCSAWKFSSYYRTTRSLKSGRWYRPSLAFSYPSSSLFFFLLLKRSEKKPLFQMFVDRIRNEAPVRVIKYDKLFP